MKAPMDSSKAQAPSEEQKAENARPAHDLTLAPAGELPADVTPHPKNDTAEAAPAASAPLAKAPVGETLLRVDDLPQYKFARGVQVFPNSRRGTAESRYFTTVYGMIKAQLRETPELRVDTANKQGVVDFYLDKRGNLVGRKLSSSSGSPNLDTAVMAAIAAAAPYPAPPSSRARNLRYNFGRR
jgi:protein TonB